MLWSACLSRRRRPDPADVRPLWGCRVEPTRRFGCREGGGALADLMPVSQASVPRPSAEADDDSATVPAPPPLVEGQLVLVTSGENFSVYAGARASVLCHYQTAVYMFTCEGAANITSEFRLLGVDRKIARHLRDVAADACSHLERQAWACLAEVPGRGGVSGDAAFGRSRQCTLSSPPKAGATCGCMARPPRRPKRAAGTS